MISWITDKLGTASYYYYESVRDKTDAVAVDIRELTDKEGNTASLTREKIQTILRRLQDGEKVIICCDKGISRSNAIAVGVLIATGMPYEKALQLVIDKVGASDINLGLLHDIRSFQEPKAHQKISTNILVTGATGFIGQALTKALKAEHKLCCPSHQELDLGRDLPLLDLYINKNKLGFVVHLAHPRLHNNVSAMAESTAIMKNILEVCRLNGLGLLYLSGLVVFSGYNSASPLKANSSLQPWPRGTYGESKSLCEELIRLYQKNYGLEVIILRPAALYGKGMDRATFVSKFFESATKGETIHTHEYNNGLPVFDFIYIDDLIEVIQLALQKRPKIPLNIGTGKGTSTYALAQAVARTAGSPSKVETLRIYDDTYKIIVDPAEAEKHLGWRAKIDLDVGLKELWQYYRGEGVFKFARQKE